jgi:hypothetical protein
MSAQSLPVAVHRWFTDKEGWAYHSSLRDHLPALIGAVDRELKASGEGVFVKQWPHGWLIGERSLDRQCLNEDATRRAPTIIRMAHVRQEPTEREKGQVLGALRKLALPTVKGPSDALLLTFEPTPTLPVWPRQDGGSRGFWSRLFSPGAQDERPPMSGLELARQLESYWRYVLDCGTPQEIYALLAENWRGVTAGGRLVRRSDLGGPGRIRASEFPALGLGRERIDAILDRGTLVVAGEARVNDSHARCVHVYALRPDRGTWEMITATATPLLVEAVPVSPAAAPAPRREAPPAS